MWKFHQYFQVLHVVVFSCSCHIIYMYPQNNTAAAANTTIITTTTNINDGSVPNKLKANSIHTRSSNSNSNNHIEALDLMHSSNSNRHVAVDSRVLVTIAERVHSNDKIDRMNANENFTTLIQNVLVTNKQQQQQQQQQKQKQKHYINNKIVGSLAATAIRTTMPSNGGNVMESVDGKIVENWNGYQANSSDDLIFLVSRPVVVANSQQQQQQQHKQPNPNYKEFSQVDQANDLLTIAVVPTSPAKSAIEAEDSLISVSGRLSITNDNDYNNNNNHNNDNDNDAEDYVWGDAKAVTGASVVTDRIPHKIQLSLTTSPPNRTNDNSYEDDAHDDEQFSIITELDLSEFVALIPIEQAKAIAKFYQQHDAEVREAYAFMASDEFERLQQQIIQVPEITDLLHYLNGSGLNLVNLLHTLTNFTQSHLIVVYDEDNNESLNPLTSSTTLKSLQINENSFSTLSTDISTLNTLFIPNDHLQGLQGLLENILEILPQDQLLALFLEKLETKQVFSHLFERLGSDAFAHILLNLQNSATLHHLMFTLHRNGINVMRLIDILKSFFFVGTF